MEVGTTVGEGKNRDGDGVAVDGGDGKADAFDRDGAFGDHPLADGGGDADFEGPVGGLGVECGIGGGDDGVEDEELAGAIDVALDDVAAERAAGGGGELEVEECAGCKRAEGGLVEGFLGEVGVEEAEVVCWACSAV